MSFLQLVIYTGRVFSLAIDMMRKKPNEYGENLSCRD
jgi:hypothetical protein